MKWRQTMANINSLAKPMMAEAKPTTRDVKGRFAIGHPGGLGRSAAVDRARKYLASLGEIVTVSRLVPGRQASSERCHCRRCCRASLAVQISAGRKPAAADRRGRRRIMREVG